MKKCMFCEEEAKLKIKNTKDYYCEECAEEQFSDTSYLVPVEEQKNEEKSAIARLEEEQEEIIKEEEL